MNRDDNQVEKHFLTPRNDVEIGVFQKKLLDGALRSEDVANIAITGPYGSGKSSFVRSYEEMSNKRFAYVSLAEFSFDRSSEQDETPADSQKSSTYLLERKIIDQLAARHSGRKSIRWSKVEYPSALVSRNHRIISMAFVVALVLSVAVVALCTHAASSIQHWGPYAVAGCYLFLVVLALGLWYWKSGCPPIFKSLSLEGVHAELESSACSGSFFDEHLSFIIELFESWQDEDDAYVFEDLDRLGREDILTQLRELCSVLNNALSANKKTIKFIYCLGDEVILGEGRTKFFDLMVPVVPAIGGWNSYGGLVRQLGDKGTALDKKLLRNTALYLDDYRLLKATVADYLVHLEVFDAEGREGFDPNKLFAMIVIKNVVPKVYLGLQCRSGKLNSFLEKPSAQQGGVADGRIAARPELIEKYIREALSEESADEENSDIVDRSAQLVVFLIEAKFIDESYRFYLARPDYEGLSSRDSAWLLLARGGRQQPEVVLDDPQSVCEYLYFHEYSEPEILNISLLEYSMRDAEPRQAFRALLDCMVEHDPDFANLATRRLLEFPAEAMSERADFASSVEGLDMAAFALALVAVSSEGASLRLWNGESNGMLADALEKEAGRYTDAYLEPFRTVNPSIEGSLVEALALLGGKAIEIAPEAAPELKKRLAGAGLYRQSRKNCLTVLQTEFPSICDDADVLDEMASRRESLAWTNAAGNIEAFLDEYLSDGGSFATTERAFLSFANLDMTSDKRLLLVRAYDGSVSSIDSVDDTAMWDAMLESGTVPCTCGNAFQYLKEFGATSCWVEFVNEGTLRDIPCDFMDDSSLVLVSNKVINAFGLDDDKYRVFVGALEAYSLQSIPRGIPSGKKKVLFECSAPAINRDSMQLVREFSDEKLLLNYVAGNVEGYISVACSNRPNDVEIAGVLGIEGACLAPSIDRLITLLRGSIALRDEYDDAVVALLLKHGKLSSEGRRSALLRFGCDSDLDKAIVGVASTMPKADLSDVSDGLLVAIASSAGSNKRLEMLEIACKRSWNVLAHVLQSFECDEVDRALRGSRPARGKLSATASAAFDVLIDEGRATEGRDGRVYLRRDSRR